MVIITRTMLSYMKVVVPIYNRIQEEKVINVHTFFSFKGPATISKIDQCFKATTSEDCAGGCPSIKCYCKIPNYNCKPSDTFEPVMSCDGTEAVTDTECNYYKIVGTTYQSTISEAWSYSETLEFNIKMNLFELLSAGLGLSGTTGYSWGSISNEVMNEETRVVLTAVVKPGQKVIIEQAVGYCDSKLKLYFNY